MSSVRHGRINIIDNQRLLVSIRSTEASPEPASILVGHAETLLPLLSLLGLYKDETPPTANNYHTQQGTKPRLRPDVQSETKRGVNSDCGFVTRHPTWLLQMHKLNDLLMLRQNR